jgi:hypothetical protein
VKCKQNLYELEAVPVPNQARIAKKDQLIDTWHRPLGHLSIKKMKLLANGMINDFEINNAQSLEFCNACMSGKQHHDSFPTGEAT